jgi:hypothetical protein
MIFAIFAPPRFQNLKLAKTPSPPRAAICIFRFTHLIYTRMRCNQGVTIALPLAGIQWFPSTM